MSSSNDNLGRKEAMLLLYVAGELEPLDRAAVDKMILTDAAAREMLDELRGAQSAVAAGLARLDELQPLPPHDAVLRSVGRAMHQWQADQLARPPQIVPRPHARFGWRSYVTAAAAVLLVAFLIVRWSNQPQAPLQGPLVADSSMTPFETDDEPAFELPKDSPAYEPVLALDKTFGDDALALVERDLAGLHWMSLSAEIR